MSKYCLVRFIEDDILYVVSTKKINPIDEKLVRAPYKKMGYYEAVPLEFHDDRILLENKRRVMKQKENEKNDEMNDARYEVDNSLENCIILPTEDSCSNEEDENVEFLCGDIDETIYNNSDDSIKDPDYAPEKDFDCAPEKDFDYAPEKDPDYAPEKDPGLDKVVDFLYEDSGRNIFGGNQTSVRKLSNH